MVYLRGGCKMRRLILVLMVVVVGGLSAAQDADAVRGQRYYSRYQQHRPSRIYEDSGILFESDWMRTQRRHRPSRTYEDSGIAF